MTVFSPLFWLRIAAYLLRARQQRLSYEAQTGKGKTRVKTSRMSGSRGASTPTGPLTPEHAEAVGE